MVRAGGRDDDPQPGGGGDHDPTDDVVVPDEVIPGDRGTRGADRRDRGAVARGRARAPFFRRRESGLGELLRFLPDVGRLLRAIARDDRVPWHAKLVAMGAVAYVISPLDLVPDTLGRAGKLDDAWVAGRALRYLFQEAGYDVMHDLWEGSDDGFALLLMLAGVER